MSTRDKLLLEGILLEHSFLKVPLSGFFKFFRLTQKSLEKEIHLCVQQLTQLASKKNVNKSDILKEAKQQLEKLNSLKTKLLQVRKMEKEKLEVIQKRIFHLKLPFINDMSLDYWYKLRIDRLLVDHLARNDCITSASLLVSNSSLFDLTDLEIFKSINTITASLEKKQCTLALKWCATNRSKLIKLKSNLEFNLRIQEYVELVKKKKDKEAIIYAKKFFNQYTSTSMPEIKRAMSSIAFRDVKFYPYQDLYSDDRWNTLISQFKDDCYRFHGLPPCSLLEVYIRAGLTTLKTERCFNEKTKNLNCPVCQPGYAEIAKTLPYSRRQHSSLVCKITGKFMNDDNPPMALPNGYVYSKEALENISKYHNGDIICPETKLKCSWNELRRVYIT